MKYWDDLIRSDRSRKWDPYLFARSSDFLGSCLGRRGDRRVTVSARENGESTVTG